MPSIRRSLLGYLLLLLVLAFGGVGVLVYEFAKEAMKAREKAEADRIEQAYQQRAKDAQDKFNADLLSEAHNVWEAVRPRLQSQTVLGTGQENSIGAAAAPKEEVQQFHVRTTLLLFGSGPAVPGLTVGAVAAGLETPRRPPPPRQAAAPGGDPPAPRTGGSGRSNGGPGGRQGERGQARPAGGPPPDPLRMSALWVGYDTPRAMARIQDELRESLAEYEPRTQIEYQVDIALGDAAHAHRGSAIARSGGMPVDLTFDHAAFDRNPNLEHLPPDDVEVPGEGAFRRVVVRREIPATKESRPWHANLYLSIPGPPPPNFVPRFGPWARTTDQPFRYYVQCALPRAVLADRIALDQKDRDEQLASVRNETRDQLALLRARLGLIGGGTFLALVVGGWLIVARGLFPMRRLSDAVSQVSERDFKLHIEPADLGRELAPIHARLTQTLDQLRRAFAREKQAVADISHELRTPIASLQATLDVALRKPRTPEQYRTTLEDCRAICKQLGQLVERIMVLASLDAGTARTVRTRSDAADIAAGCAAVIRPLAASHGLEFGSRVAAPLELDTDPDKLREVLVNLLHNAVEYNQPGGRIDLHGRRENGSVVLEVRDTGIGMAPDVRDKIFERFYRADASRQATGVHAGLGLAIVKEYVERLGGRIAVETEPGVGSTFRVTLPAPADVPAEPVFPAGHEAGEPVPSGS